MAISGLRLACALLLLQLATADPTTSLMFQLTADADPEGCGELAAACCLRRATRCNARNLDCVPVDAAGPRCMPCGGTGEPACSGARAGARGRAGWGAAAAGGARAAHVR